MESLITESLLVGAAKDRDLSAWIHQSHRSPTTDEMAVSRSYRSFLPVAVWGDLRVEISGRTDVADDSDLDRRNCAEDVRDARRRRGVQRRNEQANRRDPFVIDRFERILSWAEMLDVNRPTQDDDDKQAKRAIDDLDEISIGNISKKPITRLRLDLDLSPQDRDLRSCCAPITLPEWDYRAGRYHLNHCAIFEEIGPTVGEQWRPNKNMQQTIRKVSRQFEGLRQRRGFLTRQIDGGELDTDALVSAKIDFLATGLGSDRIYCSMSARVRSLSVALLVDSSMSTDSWVENRRVLDVEKEAITVMAHGLAASGDDHAVYSFSSRNRGYVRVDTLKAFDEPTDATVFKRIAAMRPGYYTRIGAALRYAAMKLGERESHSHLLLLVTDGKPNDVDNYEGRYGIEDTRKAIQECRAKGIAAFAITIDKKSHDYLKFAFGLGGYSIISNATRLPMVLPTIYRNLIC